MSEDDLERTLREAFAAQARGAVGDSRPAPAPRFASEPAPRRHRGRLLAPLAAAAAVVAVVGGILTIVRDTGGNHDGHLVAGRSDSRGASASATAPTVGAPSGATSSLPGAKPGSVHVRLFNADGETYGVGIPVVAIFSNAVVDARPFARATTVTVNDKPLHAAWYFMKSAEGLGAMEAHLRPEAPWPAHAHVHVAIDTQGLSAGPGLTYDDSLTLSFATGAKTVAKVDARTNVMTVYSDDKPLRSMPVSLGRPKTPTLSGTKVIMATGQEVKVPRPGYSMLVENAQQLTYDGEYLYGAPWNAANIKRHVDNTDGCTNLLATDAANVNRWLHVGDVVQYEHTGGPVMSPQEGFGDWNVPWSTWVKGGLLPTS